MQSDRAKWNCKFNQEQYPIDTSDIVSNFAGIARCGTALDIAAGNGRNAVFLAENGFKVDALDISDVGLKKIIGQHAMIRAACIDFDHYDLRPNRYSLILNIRYLNRHLIPQITAALIPGGVLIFETYLKRPEFTPQRRFCDHHLLEVNELLKAFLNLEIIYYRETITASGDAPYPVASLVAINR